MASPIWDKRLPAPDLLSDHANPARHRRPERRSAVHALVRASLCLHQDRWVSSAFVKSHIVPFQLLIYPLSRQIGYHQTISSVFGSKSASIIPVHRFRPGRRGRRRQRTLNAGAGMSSGLEIIETIATRWSANRRAGPFEGAMRPASSRK